ncbi:FtsK/SpoIIIE domain-containing protein [Stackebrandtia nassauensis]|uniref:Cell division FtsK/SpoIIIE n=1 Tax=Stackebrandtia nassauensis (strain DSM 44728 / CIP 108903 / NRRL B-16338 / NBRC 102104 / LLR-40K-21) TaxID=446470 RepID=D3PWE5_STANL|nr:FtsK/SpoIIIE domain-containing protein [Stackebrandtia nassauensis]ADD41302.1 cell division FtsK/SpoIIIE [Stackebrandtia nassauensis DSM 44728]
MAGWRSRLASHVAAELSTARGAVRQLAQRADRRATEAKRAASRAMDTAREKQAALTSTHRAEVDRITAKAESDIDNAVAELTEVTARLSAPCADAEWSRWTPAPVDRSLAAPLLRVGSLAIGSADAETQRPPALVGLMDHSHLRIAGAAEAALPSVLLRAIGCAEPGACRLTVYDPERLGGSLAGFAPLAPAGLLSFVGPHGLSDMLDEHVEHIRRINATVLAGDHASLRELAETTGRRPEPWRLLVLLGAEMDDWTKDQRAQLTRIRRTGVACGVHLIVVGTDAADDANTLSLDTTSTTLAGQAPVRLDPAPPSALITGTCRRIAEVYAAGPQPTRLSDLIPETLWTKSSACELSVPLGEGSDGRLADIVLGDNPPHALIGGPSGSGKTNLIYSWLGALTARYHPDELALYMLDFKEGVSFARFAGGRRDPSWLPHVRLVGVNINDDREFGLALLRYLRQELRRRAEAAKRHEATKLEELRAVDPQGRWPRIMAVIDEFQVLLDGRDSVAAEAVALLEDLARRGRSQGIHLVLASQDVAGIEALWGRPSLIAQFTLRIALPKARRLLAEANNLAEEIPRYHAVVNSDSGVTQANRVVRLPNASDRAVWDPLQEKLWRQRPADNDSPLLFDGDHVPVLPERIELPTTDPTPVAVLGKAIDVSSRAATLRLTRTPGRNLAILGTRTTEACDVLAGAALSVARTTDVRVTICCLDPDAAAHAYRLAWACEAAGSTVDWQDKLDEVVTAWEEQPTDRPHLVLLYAVDAAGSSLTTAGRNALRSMLLTGPERRVHTFGWWRSVPRLREDLGGYAARFDAIDAWVALDVQGPELAPLSPQPGGPAWYPRTRRGLFFDRAVHRQAEVLIPYDTESVLPTVDNMLTGSPADEH